MFRLQKYLSSLLDSANYSLTHEDKKKIKLTGLEEWILLRLFSKKFRKNKADPECIQRTRAAIHTATTSNKPFPVVFFQGAYKLWRFPSSPEVDWAEFFHLSYVLEYLAPIIAAYKPGVNLTYYMHTLLMEAHDNLTTDEILAYIDSFEQLLKTFKPHLPKYLTISILKDSNIYSRKEYFRALDDGLEKAKETYNAFPPEKKDDFQRMSQLNIKWKGKERWDLLSKKEKENKILKSALYELSATSNLPKVMERVKAPENILLFTKGTNMFIGIGSTRTSIAKYWVGFGVLEKDEKGYYARILTPSQYEKAIKQPHKEEASNIIKMKNFSTLKIFPRMKFGR